MIIWGFEGENGRLAEKWTYKKAYEKCHNASINYLRTYLHENNNEIYILTMCMGGTLKLWQGTNRDNIEYRD